MLSVENLSFSFRRQPLFTNLNFSVKKSELCVISGSNGTGKSTLLSILAGLRLPTQGKILREKDQLEYLGAEYNHLFLKMSAHSNLSFWQNLQAHQLEPTDLQSELDDWHLGHPFFSRELHVERFSTGMKRRLALARVCLSPNPLWILDEPLFGLDQNAIGIFSKKLQAHLKTGGAAIMVSHDSRVFEGLSPTYIELGQYKV